MIEVKDKGPVYKKKYLYLDKFEKYKEEQNVWELSTNERLKKLNNRADTALWLILVGCTLSMVAILISVLGQT